MTAYRLDEESLIARRANEMEHFDELSKRLADGYDDIWDQIHDAKVIRLHGAKLTVCEALVLASFLPDEERRCVMDDVREHLRDHLYIIARDEYYGRAA